MNYTGYLLGFCHIGETGNSIIVIAQEKKQILCLKLFPGGNSNVVISKKNFKQLLSNKILEPIEKVPKDIFADIKLTWDNNDKKVVLED